MENFATLIVVKELGEARVALGYLLEQLLHFFRALQTSRVHHNSIVHTEA